MTKVTVVMMMTRMMTWPRCRSRHPYPPSAAVFGRERRHSAQRGREKKKNLVHKAIAKLLRNRPRCHDRRLLQKMPLFGYLRRSFIWCTQALVPRDLCLYKVYHPRPRGSTESRTVSVLQVMCLLPRTQCQCDMRTNGMTDSFKG